MMGIVDTIYLHTADIRSWEYASNSPVKSSALGGGVKETELKQRTQIDFKPKGFAVGVNYEA
jgi:hypothetical protein